jgi:hypothetical protein
VNVVDVEVVVDVVGLMLGLFPPVAGVFSEFPGPVVVVVVDVVVVSTQFLLLVTWAQLGAATTETAETAIATAKMAATVSSISIRLTLIHPPFYVLVLSYKISIDPIVLPLCGPHLLYHPTPTAKAKTGLPPLLGRM